MNCAGVFGELQPILKGDPARWIETIRVNTIGAYMMCRHFAPEMVRNGWGRIISVSSASSLSPPNGVGGAYATSKVALNFFTRQLASELAGTGVTANVFHPGEVMTDMWSDIRLQSQQTGSMRRWVEMVEQTGGDSPTKSVELILELVGPDSDHVNGQFLWIRNGLKQPMPSWD